MWPSCSAPASLLSEPQADFGSSRRKPTVSISISSSTMAKSIAVEADLPLVQDDVADSSGRAYDASEASDADTVVYRISGAFFFGAASTVGSVLDRIADQRKNFILDFSAVPLFDSTAANVIESAAHKARRAGVRFVIAGAAPQIRRMAVLL